MTAVLSPRPGAKIGGPVVSILPKAPPQWRLTAPFPFPA